GLCELPQRTLDEAVRLLGRPAGTDAVHASHLGVNHQGWFVRIVVDGEDVLDAVLRRIATLERGGGFGVDGLVMQRLGALPLRYLRLFYHRQRVVAEARDRDRGAELAALSS